MVPHPDFIFPAYDLAVVFLDRQALLGENVSTIPLVGSSTGE
jgi:hypothetical protein